MRTSRKSVYVLMAVTVLSAPLLACTLPGLSMSEEEKECCHQMADQCGSSQMEESHSCCTTTPAAASGSLQPAMKFSSTAPAVLGHVVTGAEQACIAIDPVFAATFLDYSKSPPGHISVLRI